MVVGAFEPVRKQVAAELFGVPVSDRILGASLVLGPGEGKVAGDAGEVAVGNVEAGPVRQTCESVPGDGEGQAGGQQVVGLCQLPRRERLSLVARTESDRET